jgi:hypothetical protein
MTKQFTVLGFQVNIASIIGFLLSISPLIEHLTGHPANDFINLIEIGVGQVSMFIARFSGADFKLNSTTLVAMLLSMVVAGAPFIGLDGTAIVGNGQEIMQSLTGLMGLFGVHSFLKLSK